MASHTLSIHLSRPFAVQYPPLIPVECSELIAPATTLPFHCHSLLNRTPIPTQGHMLSRR
jgi:hypothetical protein